MSKKANKVIAAASRKIASPESVLSEVLRSKPPVAAALVFYMIEEDSQNQSYLGGYVSEILVPNRNKIAPILRKTPGGAKLLEIVDEFSVCMPVFVDILDYVSLRLTDMPKNKVDICWDKCVWDVHDIIFKHTVGAVWDKFNREKFKILKEIKKSF